MRAWGNGSKTIFFGAGWVASLLFTAQMAVASPSSDKHASKHASASRSAGHGDTAAKSTGSRAVSSHSASGSRYVTHSGDRYATRSGDRYASHYGRAVFPGGNYSRHAHYGRASYRFASYGIYHGYRGPTLQCVA